MRQGNCRLGSVLRRYVHPHNGPHIGHNDQQIRADEAWPIWPNQTLGRERARPRVPTANERRPADGSTASKPPCLGRSAARYGCTVLFVSTVVAAIVRRVVMRRGRWCSGRGNRVGTRAAVSIALQPLVLHIVHTSAASTRYYLSAIRQLSERYRGLLRCHRRSQPRMQAIS